MRTYDHVVHEPLVTTTFEKLQNRRIPSVWRQLDKGKDAGYVFGLAAETHLEAVTTAWALGEDAALLDARQRTSQLYTLILNQFDVDVVQLNVDLGGFLIAGLANDRQVLVQVAQVLRGRSHADRPHRTSPPANHHMLDALTALVCGDDASAIQACDRTAEALASPENPPGGPGGSKLPAIRAVLASDTDALHTRVADAIAVFASLNAPTASRHASVHSLLDLTMSLACRVATWRGLDVPASPYLLTHND